MAQTKTAKLHKINKVFYTSVLLGAIYLSESYLDSSKAFDNDDLSIKSFKLHREDHPNNEALYVRMLGNHCL